MKKIICSIFIITSLLAQCLQADEEKSIQPLINIKAKSYILMDYDTKEILLSKNTDEKLPPASLTKLMTSYIVSTKINSGEISLKDKVFISKKAWKMTGSRTFLNVNTKVDLSKLIKGMIVQSGNDAVIAIAEHISGSEKEFVKLMNKYAKKLNLKNTHYNDATGLPTKDHYSTAHDIALLSRAIIKDFPDHYSWYSIKNFKYNNISQNNRNKLLWKDTSVDGLKTGHTMAAGYCLASSAKRKNMRLIAVVMGTKSSKARAKESEKLLNYGFKYYDTHKLYTANSIIKKSKIWEGKKNEVSLGLDKDLTITIIRSQNKQLHTAINIKKPIIATVNKGQKLGTIEVYLGDKILKKVPLIALNTVNKGNIWHQMIDSITLWLKTNIHYLNIY
ncbi:Beta-lactamase [Arcobacter nitrofigilis DSM 7299]|uniref:serine-type D-Ala-D-Ala carboxypeptidase n=1 Tax=Arcobacter nitrofigilis (strain ATCC 33309 / DSM 7299 / CCUG 15893 / LMG 7604 / NCTC 12251 / CI) TaxID=572480 RepID=D5V4N0_ARCNC|nr:D-alanyl-D-alanine carboxypeptidase family protein [Arcobacter nitrofigilis]ADG92935.1 Beta-lactamase [Arcobacter nitrofigilis DSM 7299]